MKYFKLLDLASDLGYRLAMSGAETYRIEESISRILKAYDIDSEVYAIPNCLTVSIETPEGTPLTRMRRIGIHGNDLDAVERFSGLSRRICNERPDPEIATDWLAETVANLRHYNLPAYLVGAFFAASGLDLLFGGTLTDALCAGLCGILVGLLNRLMDRLGANQFFRTITATFLLSIVAYAMSAYGLTNNPDAVIIGTLMILVPGLLFTNAMRDIIHGDTNSGIIRIVQVLLIALAIALGTGAAWNMADQFWNLQLTPVAVNYPLLIQGIACLIGCMGFSVLFNIHGISGIFLCAAGSVFTWIIFSLCTQFAGNDLTGYFWATIFAALYSEVMARIRKYPAISYLLISIFPLIPGAGVYYTMNYILKGQMQAFTDQGFHTIAIAGILAVAILLVSTVVRIITVKTGKH